MQVSYHRDKVGPDHRHRDIPAMGTARWVQDVGVRMSCDMGTKDMSMGVPRHGNKVGAGYRHRCPKMGIRYRQEDPGDVDCIVGEGLGDGGTLCCQWQGKWKVTRMRLPTVTSQVR